MRIKTFPLQFTEDYLDKIRQAADNEGTTMKEFILSAIAEKMERDH